MWKLWAIVILNFGLGCAEIKVRILEENFLQVAGIFDIEYKKTEVEGRWTDAEIPRNAFKECMNAATSASGSLRLKPAILEPYRKDGYSVWRELCSDTDIKPIIVFGPQNPTSDIAIRDQCYLANIPHIQASWQPRDPEADFAKQSENTTEETEEPKFKRITINFYPDADEISIAYAKLLKYYKWDGFTVLYEDNFGLMRVQKILSEHTEKFPVTVRRISLDSAEKVFKELHNFQESRILLDCDVDHIVEYMNIATAFEMVDPYQHYILTSMDAANYEFNLKQFESNVTWLSITNFNDLPNMLADRVGKWKNVMAGQDPPVVTRFRTEALLMDDVAMHILSALDEVSQNVTNIDHPNYSPCDKDGTPWSVGALYQNKILQIQTTGVSGNIAFDENGKRVNYTLYVNEIYKHDMQIIGLWESGNAGEINETRTVTAESDSKKTTKEFIIIARKAEPYFFERNKTEDEADDSGVKFEGFSVDLVDAIFQVLRNMNYNYTYKFSEKNFDKQGSYDAIRKKWNGLIGELLDKKADLAVCDLTITEERKKVVDFSVPFMSLGISILFMKEKKVDPDLFSFLNPYSVDVWFYTATAYCIVSLVLYICSRISPADWENPQPCDKDPEELENIWNFKNCTWLTMGSIMTQGCDILPKAIGSRWVCSMWWFFAMIVCQTYIAQLAASMTSELENAPINTVDELANQNKILYGAQASGSTVDFFKNSKDKTFQRMYQNMIANPVVLVDSNDEGERRVLRGKNRYAFFMESSTIEYKLNRNCDLKQVGGLLDSKDYGIAMPANSPFRSEINRAILKLRERSVIDRIRKKWWVDKDHKCTDVSTDSDPDNNLELKHLMGAFLVLIVGLVFCLFITAGEFMNEIRNIVVREKVTHKEAMVKELKASLNFFQLEKPVLWNSSKEGSEASSKESDKSEDRQNLRAAVTANFLDLEKLPQ